MKVKFKQWDCVTKIGWYGNGNLAIQLFDIEDDSLVAVATVNTGEILPERQVAIKDYSENEEMVEALEAARVIKDYVKISWTGYVPVPVFTISEELRDEIKEV